MRVVALLLCLFLVPVASAQTFYLTDTSAGVSNQFINCPDNPIYVLDLALPADGKAYQGPGGCSFDFIHATSAAMTLEGDMLVSVFVSCDEPVASPSAEAPGVAFIPALVVDVFFGEEQVAAIDVKESYTCTGESDVHEIAATVPLAAQELPAGTDLRVNVRINAVSQNPGGAAANAHVKVGPSFPSSIVLPGGAGGNETFAPIVVNETLEGDVATFSHAWETPRTAQHRFNWTHDGAELVLTGNATAQNGTALLTVLDAAGATLHEHNTSADGNWTARFAADAGNLTVVVDYQDFVGTLSMQLGAAPEDEPEPEEEPETPADDNETAEPEPTDEESPGLPVALGLLTVGAVAVLRRRD